MLAYGLHLQHDLQTKEGTTAEDAILCPNQKDLRSYITVALLGLAYLSEIKMDEANIYLLQRAFNTNYPQLSCSCLPSTPQNLSSTRESTNPKINSLAHKLSKLYIWYHFCANFDVFCVNLLKSVINVTNLLDIWYHRKWHSDGKNCRFNSHICKI